MRSSLLSAIDDDARHTTSLAGLAAVLLLVVLSLVVVRKLQVRSMLEACAMSQAPGCETAADDLRVSRLVDRLWGR
jgi:hypothetical protein